MLIWKSKKIISNILRPFSIIYNVIYEIYEILIYRSSKLIFPKSGCTTLLTYDEDSKGNSDIIFLTPDNKQLSYCNGEGIYVVPYRLKHRKNTDKIIKLIEALSLPSSWLTEDKYIPKKISPCALYVVWYYDEIVSINGVDVSV
jgi:hypothetical protein